VSSQQCCSSGVYAGASAFNAFFNDLSNGSEYTPSGFVENIKLGGTGQYTGGWRNFTQRNFNRLEIRSDLKFNKGEWKVLYFGWNNPTQLHVLSATT